MIPPLPPAFLQYPIAHRAYHDVHDGRPENSRAAISAAIDEGYGIEIDLQLSSDGAAMVFHDYDLSRLTEQSGAVRQLTADALQQIPLKGGNETIPTLPEILELVEGRVPVLIEIKDQDGGMGVDVGQLERATAEALTDYAGPVAVMSFNPNAVAEMARLAPGIPRGLTTSAFNPDDWPLSAETCAHLRDIPDFDRTGSSFISHEANDLKRDRVRALRAQGVPVLTWTVTSQAMEDRVNPLCDNVTFERYAARPRA